MCTPETVVLNFYSVECEKGGFVLKKRGNGLDAVMCKNHDVLYRATLGTDSDLGDDLDDIVVRNDPTGVCEIRN